MASEFTVVLRGPSAAVFREGEAFPFTVHTDDGPLRVRYTSRWIKRSEDVTLPGHLWIEVVGGSSDLETALPAFANAGLVALPVMAVSANAAISAPAIELGYDSTPGLAERDYFQSFVAPESGSVQAVRFIDIPATSELVVAVIASQHQERLNRAMAQYQLALENWDIGSSILTVAHLWMAVEALTKVRVRVEIKTRGLENEAGLAQDLGVELKKLDPTVRRELIFRGDKDCYAKALAASDGFEHGFSQNDKLRQLTMDVRDRTAGYVRREIFDRLQISETTRQKLLSDPFDKPLGDKPLAKYMRGKLVSATGALAKGGNAYPFLRWKTGVKRAKVDAAGKLQVQFDDSITPELADGVGFQPARHEVWKPH